MNNHNNNNNSTFMSALINSRLFRYISGEYHPWYKINLTKLERHGKTYQELQEIRKRKWKESQQNTNQQDINQQFSK